MHTRKAVVIYEEEFSSVTVLKPFSVEYLNFLYVLNEDVYGEFRGELVTKRDLKKRLNLCDEEFDEMLKLL